MILLDTCAIIWNALEPSKLTPKAKKVIKNSGSELIICDISIWEISMLIKRKRVIVDETASGFINLILQSQNYQIQPITPEITELSVNFGAEINNDPADRIIAATSILNNAPIVTADQNLRNATILEAIW
ncbi:MAG: twitching motility protein PilT [endosymbiont of Escarpia spicata]|uniref:Twitching motility protein PilT n=1 Tax=endosymbiont of Escarpia spicata TaxID=2200908 RepID=A0A370DPD0_9GAMM|nr:MAG: twitching motility protein PilT [endosymbiont of Escarpia spicata]